MISAVRKKKARPQYAFGDDDVDILSLIPSDADVEQEVAQKCDNEVVAQALQELSDKYRDVLVLQYFEGLTYQEISDVLQIPVRTVGTRLNRAKKQLEKSLADRL